MKEFLYSKSNFFYLISIDWEKYQCEISNGIDQIKSTPDQLVKVRAYLESVNEKTGISYLIENQRNALLLEDSIITEKYFDVIDSLKTVDGRLKNYKLVKFKEDIISDLF